MSANENFADSNRARVAWKKEDVFGTTPTPADMQVARYTSSSLTLTKETSTSDEIRSDRQVPDVTELSASTGGDLEIEYSLVTYDELEIAALGDPGAAGTLFNDSVTYVANQPQAGQFSVTGAGIETGFNVGEYVYFSVGAGSPISSFYEIAALEPNKMVLIDPLGNVTIDGSGGAAITNVNWYNGTEKYSFSLEQGYLDASFYQLFVGQRVGTWTLSIEAGARITGTFSFMGLDMYTSTAEFGDSYIEATDTDGLNATTNVANVLVDGETLPVCIQSISLSIDNALRSQPGVGNKFPCGVGLGRQQITGSLSAYFADGDLYNRFVSHADVELLIPLVDADGNAKQFHLPKVKFLSDPLAPGAIDTDIMDDIEFQAVFDKEAGYTIAVSSFDGTLSPPPVVTYSGIYTGDGTAANVVTTGLDATERATLAIIKNIDAAGDCDWYDSVRGATQLITTASDAPQTTNATGVTAFGDGSVTVGAGVSNTLGEQYSIVSLSALPGVFDIVEYTGTGLSQQIPTEINSVGKTIVIKALDDTLDWPCCSTDQDPNLDELNYLNLSDADAVDATAITDRTSPLSFTVGTSDDTNKAGVNYIAYIFADNPAQNIAVGYDVFGTSGTTIVTGFEPKALLVKGQNITTWKMYFRTGGGAVDNGYVLSTSSAAFNDLMTFNPDGFTTPNAGGSEGHHWIAIG